MIELSSVQSLSHVWFFVTPWTAACQVSSSITNSRSPPKPIPIVSVMPSNHLILCSLLLLPPIFASIRVFSNESALHIRWQKYWSFSFNISPSNEHPGLVSFRMAWLDLLAVQGTLKSLLQHHSLNAPILQRSTLFIVQLSHPYTTTRKTRALTRWNHLNAEFQRIARRDKKAFFSDQCKEIEENNRMGKTRDLFKKIGDTKGIFHAKMCSKRTQMVWT